MDITINRQSVCMGDDVDVHAITFAINQDSTFSSIFHKLIAQRYFPSIIGNDVVWVLNCGQDDLIAWKTKENKFYTRFVTTEPKILGVKRWQSISDIYFTYYSPTLRRAKYIFEHHDGIKHHISHEGFMPEYQSYGIPQSTEQEWMKTLHK